MKWMIILAPVRQNACRVVTEHRRLVTTDGPQSLFYILHKLLLVFFGGFCVIFWFVEFVLFSDVEIVFFGVRVE